MKRFQHHTEQQMQRMSQEPKQVCFSAFGNIDGVRELHYSACE